MSNNLIQIIRKKFPPSYCRSSNCFIRFTDTLNKIRPQYNQPSFVEFLSKPVEESKEPLKEGSKIFQQFESIIDEKYREFQRTFQVDEKKIFESIVKEPSEYIKNAQLKSDYVEFLVEYSAQNPMLRPGELREKLENSDQRPPHLWMEFQQKHLGKDLIDRLEKIRTDPQFQDYIKAKERWKEDMKSRQPPIAGDKAIDNHLKYVEILPQVHRWIMRQLYMDFRHHNQANFFKFLEKDFNDQKQLAREKVQKQQMQRQQQIPQQSNPYEQQQTKQHPQQQNPYDPMKQQQMSSHNSAYDPMKQQQQQMSSQSNSYDSMKQNSQQQQIHQYDQNKYNPYDANKHTQQQQQQQPSSHYDSSKLHNQQGSQGMQNQYSSQGQGQYSQYGQQQQSNNYQQQHSSQYDSMKQQQQQYPQQNMYDSTNKMSQNMNPYEQANNKQQPMNSYDPSKQYQQGHQMNQINTHASPQLSHGHQMNQSNMQQRGVAPNAAVNRSGKMMGAHMAGSQGQTQGQGPHNYQQTSSSLPQHQNMPHNQAQISTGQSPRTLPSPGMHQGTHSQQGMMAQQQQMHSSQSGHMQHMQNTIQNQPSPHQTANNPYSMNSSYNPHQNPSMSQMQHKQSKMGVGAPSPSQLQNQSMPSTNPSPMSHSGMSGHYGSQSSQQGRQMPGQNQNMSQGSSQYNSSMSRESIDSLNPRQSLSQQSQYSNSDSLTPRQSLSQNQPQNQNMYQQNQASNQAQQQAQAEAQAKARAQAEAEQARLRAEAQAQARAQAEAQAQARAKAEAENQARMRAEAEQARLREAQARAKAEAENQARMRAEAEAQQARLRAEAEAQARAQAQAEAQAKAQAEAQAAKEAALKRSQQQQQQAQQAALQTQMRPHVIQKETFNLSDDFGNLNFNDFGTGLNEVADKFRHQYGNKKVIEDFERAVRDEIYQRDESIAELEQQTQAQKKRVKVNPSFEEELNLIPSASTSTSTKELFISPTSTAIPEPKQPVLKPVEKELNELKMDPRVKVDERGSLSVSPYIDAIFYKMNDGIISYHEKLVLKIFQDESKGIEIQEMANLSDFMSEYNEVVFFALKDAQLKVLVETWLEFSELCAQKANSKIQDLDDLFG